jgi:arylsulfatase A-like enzyme
VRRLAAPGLVAGLVAVAVAQDAPRPRNAIIFVADGLRHGSVNATDTPALHRVRTEGVYFANAHSVFPTQTMPNAAAIATGHYPGDTGQFANALFIGYPLFNTANFGRAADTMVPDIEHADAIADINDHFGGNFLREASLLAYARSYGYNTAAVGKTGPAAVQDVSELAPLRGRFRTPITIVIEGDTGAASALPLSETMRGILKAAGLGPAPPARDQSEGTNVTPGTHSANVEHQQWLTDATTKAILPAFAKNAEPFVVVFWSGDPDQTQHAHGDSLNRLEPGVNGVTSKAAVRNADRSLGQILEFLDAHPGVRDNTNLFVTADHGFSTVSRRDVDAVGTPTASYAATLSYRDVSGRQDVNEGHLPTGFLAIDLARELNLPLYDPEQQTANANGTNRYVRIDPTVDAPTAAVQQHPTSDMALIGGMGRISRPTDASVVIAQTSIHVPANDRALIRRIVRFLATQDYIGGIFVNDRFGEMVGALPMSALGLIGTATTPKPAIVVNFKSFALDRANPFMTGVMVGSTRQHGQGDHGSLSGANRFINMAALGPDFKRRFVVRAPVSNADLQPTLARALRMRIPSLGKLRGRVVTEALSGGPSSVRFSTGVARSQPTALGESTVLMFQKVGEHTYLDQACFTRERACTP